MLTLTYTYVQIETFFWQLSRRWYQLQLTYTYELKYRLIIFSASTHVYAQIESKQHWWLWNLVRYFNSYTGTNWIGKNDHKSLYAQLFLYSICTYDDLLSGILPSTFGREVARNTLIVLIFSANILNILCSLYVRTVFFIPYSPTISFQISTYSSPSW